VRYLPQSSDPRLLAGRGTLDGGVALQVRDDLALVQSVGFITPVVDDPYSFGAVAAADALSGLYAKGAKPVLALNLVGFPSRTLPMSTLGEILRGGGDKATEAGALVLGGHSLDDPEPKYGMAVTGLVDPRGLVTNAGGKDGDLLLLTKPLGSGIAATAIDQRLASPGLVDLVVALMSELNRKASEAMVEIGVDGCTEVSGFGLLGHLHEMARASGLSAVVDLERVPVLDEVWDLVRQGTVPEGTHNNHRYLQGRVDWGNATRDEQLVLSDSQVSGGLLIACPRERGQALLERLDAAGVLGAVLGHLETGSAGRIVLQRGR